VVSIQILLAGDAGIALVAGARGDQLLVEQKIDAVMQRRAGGRCRARADGAADARFHRRDRRPGLVLLYRFVIRSPCGSRPTFIGYAVLYSWC